MDQNDDYAERDLPSLLEPENLVPLVVMAAVGGLLAFWATALTFW
jgi:hypothetical protein